MTEIKTPFERLNAAAHAMVVDSYTEHPFTDALEAVLNAHQTMPPPSGDRWADLRYVEWCGGCGAPEPCPTKVLIGDALGVKLAEDG